LLAENTSTNSQHSLCEDAWNLHVDGYSSRVRNGTSLLLEILQIKKQERALKFIFKASNNEVEYDALI